MANSKKTILIVEDDPDLTDQIELKLQGNGFETSVAHTGQGARGKMAGLKPDLVVLDILLSDIDGITILSEMVDDEALKNIPVIVYTNIDDTESVKHIRDLGEYPYLVKIKTPLDSLVHKIKQILEP